MRGTCSECAFEFSWGDLLRREFLLRTRFFETAEVRLIGAFVFTMTKLFRPHTFWFWTRLENPSRLGRASLFAAACTTLLMFGTSCVYSVLMVLGLRLRGWLPRMREDPAEWAYVAWNSLLDALLTLFYVDAPEEHSFYVLGVWLEPKPLPILAMAGTALIPVAFAAVPFTMRRQRLRPESLARVFLYGLPLSFFALQLPSVVYSAAYLTRLSFLLPYYSNWWAPPILVVAFQIMWWRAAASRYLEVRHATALGLSVVLIGMLIALFLGLAAAGRTVYRDLVLPY